MATARSRQLNTLLEFARLVSVSENLEEALRFILRTFMAVWQTRCDIYDSPENGWNESWLSPILVIQNP
jgi:hypothetical protein